MRKAIENMGGIKSFLMALATVALLGLFAHAQAANVVVKGIATVPVKGSLLSAVTDVERKAARRAALIDAWKQYLSDPDVASQARTLQKFSGEIEANIENFMTRVEFLDEKVDKEKKLYTVMVAAQVMDAQVQMFVQDRTGAGSQASMSGSGFAVLFLMRTGTSNKQFDDSREQTSDKSVSAQTTGDDDGNVTVSSKKKTTTGSSATLRADDEKFKTVEGADQAAAMLGKVMGPAGFEVSDFKSIADACEQSSLYDEALEGYSKKGTVPNLTQLAKLTRECGKKLEQPFKFLAVVMAEVGTPTKDKGDQTVTASIRMNVQNIEKPIPVSIANTEFQNSGIGKTTAAARGDVMKRVGEQVGREIVDMMNKKGLK
jgi:hypothetical protein